MKKKMEELTESERIMLEWRILIARLLLQNVHTLWESLTFPHPTKIPA